MKNFISGAISVAAVGTLALAAPAISQSDNSAQDKSYDAKQKGDMTKDNRETDYKAQSPEIVERDDKGKATKVRVAGQIYDVCMTSQQNDCIQPRAAGLDWGPRPLNYWPGEPASSS